MRWLTLELDENINYNFLFFFKFKCILIKLEDNFIWYYSKRKRSKSYIFFLFFLFFHWVGPSGFREKEEKYFVGNKRGITIQCYNEIYFYFHFHIHIYTCVYMYKWLADLFKCAMIDRTKQSLHLFSTLPQKNKITL